MGQKTARHQAGFYQAAQALSDGLLSVRPDHQSSLGTRKCPLSAVDDPDDASDAPEARAAAFEEDGPEAESIVVPEGEEQPIDGNTSNEDVERPRVMRNPKQPTQAEIDEHEVTHLPPR